MEKRFRCPGCNATLEYFPKEGKMHCSYCGKSYSVEELVATETGTGAARETRSVAKDPANTDSVAGPSARIKPIKIKMQIARCSSCGAELMVNDVEISSFCAYCGQATVVLDRVDECLKPDYILPFKVTREEAEEAIRSKISSGFYIPDEIRHFEVEKLRGIYVPFWLYDILYGDDQFWMYRIARGRAVVTRYSHRVADCHFYKLMADASKRLSDALSQRLEPYNMEELEDFQPMYLSGFYADRFDMGQEETRDAAVDRAKEMFNEHMERTVRRRAIRIYTSAVYEVTGAEYGLLPAWFLTFRQNDIPYTVLVNGQTKKVVGAVPCVKWKAGLTFVVLVLALCGLLVPLCGFLASLLMVTIWNIPELWQAAPFVLIGGGVLIVWTWRSVISKVKGYLESMRLTRSGVTNRFVGERQNK